MTLELSVCIPTYNSAQFLPAAVASVMSQGLSSFEILIIDNASTDETRSVVEGMDNPHIRYLRNPENIGACANHNRCIDEAKGEFIKFLCADDVFWDGLLPLQLEALRARPDAVLATCNMIQTDEYLNERGEFRSFPGYAKASRVRQACLGGMKNFIGGPSHVMFRRVATRGVHFDVQYRWTTDLKCWLDILQHGNFVNVDVPGYRYRRHPNTDSETNCPPEIRVGEFLGMLDDLGGWNLLNFIQALRLGGKPGKRLAMQRLPLILKTLNPYAELVAVLDIVRITLTNRRLTMS